MSRMTTSHAVDTTFREMGAVDTVRRYPVPVCRSWRIHAYCVYRSIHRVQGVHRGGAAAAGDGGGERNAFGTNLHAVLRVAADWIPPSAINASSRSVEFIVPIGLPLNSSTCAIAWAPMKAAHVRLAEPGVERLLGFAGLAGPIRS